MQNRLLVLWQKYNNIEAGMYPLMLSVAACLCLAFAGTGFAKTKHSAPKAAAVAAKKAAAAKIAPSRVAKASLSPRQIGPRPSRRHSQCAPPATAAS